jgi:hypothetical protein
VKPRSLAQGLTTTALGSALFVTAAVSRRKLLALRAIHVGDLDPRRAGAVTVVFGAIAGVLVSSLSVGAGAIGVTVLVLI